MILKFWLSWVSGEAQTLQKEREIQPHSDCIKSIAISRATILLHPPLEDGAAVGTLDALAFSSLPAVNAAAQWRRLANCRRFIESGFGGIEANVFRALFEGNAEEVFQEAEEISSAWRFWADGIIMNYE